MKLVPFAAAIALAACATVPPASAGPTAGLGQVASVGRLRLRPIEVIEDSRCPMNARCVWAGRLVVRTEISGQGWNQIRDLELGIPQAVAEYRAALIGAEPQKQAGAEFDLRAYRFTFTVSGR